MQWLYKTLLIPGLLALAACGFEPLYGERAVGRPSNDQMARVKIDLIQDDPSRVTANAASVGRVDIARLGQMLRNELLNSITPDGRPKSPLYNLHVDVNEGETPLAIDQAGTAQRSTLTVTATYALKSLTDGQQLLGGTSSYSNSYAITINSYSTVVGRSDAEKRAMRGVADDITKRIALYFAREPTASQ